MSQSKLIERLSQLEPEVRKLDPGPKARRRMSDTIVRFADAYLDELDDMPAWQVVTPPEAGSGPLAMTEEGVALDDVMRIFREIVAGSGVTTASGRHLGYIPGGGLYHAALADFLSDIVNKYVSVEAVSPGSAAVEQAVVDWLSQLIGFPRESAGDLTSGGSIANLTAVVVAREAAGLASPDYAGAVVYCSRHAHHSVVKALRIAGLADAPVREIDCDDGLRMRLDALADSISADRDRGLRPWLVVATAGSTDSGSIDPLDSIADLAARESVWLHVDAAYGGFFVLCDEGRARLRGLSRADSVALDPHKTMFMPYGSGAVLVRRGSDLLRAFEYQANYLADAHGEHGARSASRYSVELTKPFRGMRIWFTLKLAGIAPFRAALEEKLLLARYAWSRLRERPGIVVGPEPGLSVVLFRPEQGGNEVADRLVGQLRDSGDAFVSSTTIDGIVWLRFAIVVHRTHRAEIDRAIDRVFESL